MAAIHVIVVGVGGTRRVPVSPCAKRFQPPLDYALGDVLGTGWNKTAYALPGHPTKVARLLSAPSRKFPGMSAWNPVRLEIFAREHQALEKAKGLGLPVDPILEVGQLDGRPADIVPWALCSSRDLVHLRRDEPEKYRRMAGFLFAGERGRAIHTELLRIADLMEHGLTLPDFQVVLRGQPLTFGNETAEVLSFNDIDLPFDRSRERAPPGLEEDPVAQQRTRMKELLDMVHETRSDAFE